MNSQFDASTQLCEKLYIAGIDLVKFHTNSQLGNSMKCCSWNKKYLCRNGIPEKYTFSFSLEEPGYTGESDLNIRVNYVSIQSKLVMLCQSGNE